MKGRNLYEINMKISILQNFGNEHPVSFKKLRV